MSIKPATSVMEDKSGHYLDLRIADFIERWKPTDDSREAFEFQVQLNELIRSTYAEAAKPYQKQMMAMLQAMPIVPSWFPAAKTEGTQG